MGLGQLIEYSMRNTFLEKSYTEFSEETSPGPYPKNKDRTYLWINKQSKIVMQFVFIICSSRGLAKYVETKVLTTCFYLI